MLSEHRVVERPETPTLAIRGKVRADEIGKRLIEILPATYAAAGDKVAGAPFAMWHEVEGSGAEQVFDMEAGMPLSEPVAAGEGMISSRLPAGRVVEAIYRGNYEGLSAAYDELSGWIRQNGYHAAGAPWDWYIDDPAEVAAEDCRTLICWPIEP